MTESTELVEIQPIDAGKMVQAWITFLERERADETVQAYRRSIDQFQAWLDELEEPVELGLVTREHVLAWRDAMKERYSHSTIALRLSGIRSFFDWAIERGAPIINPTAGVRMRGRGKARRHKRDELTDDEIRALFETCAGKGRLSGPSSIDRRDRAMLALMAYCGLRTVEIERAKLGDLETKEDRLILWVWGKGRSEPDDFVVLPAPAEEALREWLRIRPGKGGHLFVGMGRRQRGRALSRRHIRSIIKSRYRKCGIKAPSKTAHSLRHSAISRAIRAGASPVQVQAMARHSDIKTTLGYYHEKSRIQNPAEDLIVYGQEREEKSTSATG